MAQVRYLTVRCPYGCEGWLTGPWLHTHRHRCRGHPWVDDLKDRAVVPAPMAAVLLPILPRDVIDGDVHPTVGRTQTYHVRQEFRNGYEVRSPIADVSARRWLRVVMAATRAKGLSSVPDALAPEGFRLLEEELTPPAHDVECPHCGQSVMVTGMSTHLATSGACRWRRAAEEVRGLWDEGWRDPYNVEGAPLKWGELMARVRWKRRLYTVDFPRWTAVLLKP